MLEHPNLVDPTEARYASIAQEMVRSGDWLTPQIPMPEGVVPYLGKPPLHFWLTAASFEVFGMDTWTARLPSFLAALLIIGVVFQLARRAYGETTAILATLITCSAAMFFLVSGTSVLDMTLTAMVTAAIFPMYLRIVEQRPQHWLLPVAAFFGALGFLTKGPIALVLIFLPFFLWGAFSRNFSWIRLPSWVLPAIVFIITAVPWFILSEQANPGFLKYFVWNENIARYLFKSYGDLYGSGHVYPRGTSWVMLFVAFLPWTVVLAWRIKAIGLAKTRALLRSDSRALFILCWGITATFFFTFVRQLHALYILPSIPGLAIFTAILCTSPAASEERPGNSPADHFGHARPRPRASTWLALIFTILLASSFIFAAQSKLSEVLSLQSAVIPITLLVLSAGYLISRRLERAYFGLFSLITQIGLASSCVLICAALVAAPFLSRQRSAEILMHRIAQLELGASAIPSVGVFTQNSYSHYWSARATDGYLEREVSVSYLPPTKIAERPVDYVLVKKKQEPAELRSHYMPIEVSGPWQLFKRIPAPE